MLLPSLPGQGMKEKQSSIKCDLPGFSPPSLPTPSPRGIIIRVPLTTFKGSSVVTKILEEVRAAASHFSQCILLIHRSNSLLKQCKVKMRLNHNLASLQAHAPPCHLQALQGPFSQHFRDYLCKFNQALH